MEMINYVPQMIDPDLQAINKTVNRQREAMLARRKQIMGAANGGNQLTYGAAAASDSLPAGSLGTVAEGGPQIKKRRRDRSKEHKSSKEQKKDKKRKHSKSKKRRRDRSKEDDEGRGVGASDAASGSNVLD